MADLKVIIAGGGIAGLATAIALSRLEHDLKLNLDIQIYEKASELREIGASIALSPNGLRTLERLGVHDALGDDVGFRGPSGLPMIYRHWKTGEVVSVDEFENVPDRRHWTARFHRAHLHQALLALVQSRHEIKIHLGKAVVSAEVDPEEGADAETDATGGGGGHQVWGGKGGRRGGVTLFFDDGTSVHGDMLIGADGLRSKVRGAFKPEHTLHWTGRTLFRATFDASLVQHIPDLPADSTHWWGPKHTFFASRLGKGQYTTVGNFDPASIQSEKFQESHAPDESKVTEKDKQSQAAPLADPSRVHWDQEGDVALFRDLYKSWNPVVRALTQATPHVRLYPNFAGEPLDTWVFGSRVTLVGDAAHTHGGAHAAGGSLALDDAWALYLALRYVLAAADGAGAGAGAAGAGAGAPAKGKGQGNGVPQEVISRALTLYDRTRRPHTERLVRSVLAAQGAAAPETDEALRLKMLNRPATTWLTEHDVEAAFASVVAEESRSLSADADDHSRNADTLAVGQASAVREQSRL